MKVYLFNTLTRKKEEFKPQRRGRILLYQCGPTVYDRAHIGNLRSFVIWDILRRVFESQGLRVKQVMNITDVDDKTIKRSKDERVSLSNLTHRYTELFLKDIDALRILRPHVLSRATEHIEEMVRLIEALLKKGYAYRADDGSIYFKISKFKKYGRMAHVRLTALKPTERVLDDNYEKEDARDFVLWKAWTKDDGDVFWETPLGKGRPGWHIECSAMSMKYLGETFDIHAGGRDLIFPHHTNEIAQSEGATGKSLARFWLHNEFVLVNRSKMAKSLKNIISLDDIKKKGFSPIAYRYWLLQAHYRTQVNFTWEALEASQNALETLYNHYRELKKKRMAKTLWPDFSKLRDYYRLSFFKHIEDDLNTPTAVSELWNIIRKDNIDEKLKKELMDEFDSVLGLGFKDLKSDEVPADVKKLVKEREIARRNKDWKSADTLRKKIKELGFSVDDTPEGPSVLKDLDI